MGVEISGKRKKSRPRKSWEDCGKKDLERCGLRGEDAYDRKKWRERIRANATRIMTLKRALLLLSQNFIRIYQIQLLLNLEIDK